MKALNFIVVFCALIFAAIVVPVMAVDETTCNTVARHAMIMNAIPVVFYTARKIRMVVPLSGTGKPVGISPV